MAIKCSRYLVRTLKGIASIGFRFYFQQTLWIQIQGCQGCQKTRNVMKNSKILIARSTIQPKLSKIKKNPEEMHQNSSKDGKWFLILFNFGWMVDLAMSIFEFLTKFLIFWHPWHPWMCIRSDLKQIWAILPPTVYLYLSPCWSTLDFWNMD